MPADAPAPAPHQARAIREMVALQRAFRAAIERGDWLTANECRAAVRSVARVATRIRAKRDALVAIYTARPTRRPRPAAKLKKAALVAAGLEAA